MTGRIRLTVLLTHPVQYYAPWFREIHRSADDIALTVLYATEPTPSQQGVGFECPFAWDVPLREGYTSRVLRQPSPGTSVAADRFWGADAPEVDAAIADSGPDVMLIMGWHSSTYFRA